MLSIITDLFGPIFAKEMLEMSRRWRYYQNRVLFGGLVLIVLLIVYQETAYRYISNTGYTSAYLARMAETFFLSYLWVQYLTVYLFVPFFLTGVISGEREQKTLDLLFTTQLYNREIIFGKLGSRVVSMLLLILSGVPIVAITMLFGGVNVKVFIQGMTATMLALLFTSSFAIYFSTTTKTTLGALVRTYWWMACWILVIPMLLALSMQALIYYQSQFPGWSYETERWLQEHFLTLLCVLNPVASFVVAVEDYTAMRVAAHLGEWYFWIMTAIPAVLSLLLIFLAILNVRREPGPRKSVIALRKVIGFIVGVITLRPLTSRLLKMLPGGKADRAFWRPVHNPLWLRARRAWVYDREQHLQKAQLGGWLLVIVVLGLLALVERQFFRHRESAMVFMMWIWMGLAIIASLVSGLSIINDRRKGFFDFVLITPLEPIEVLLGTYLGTWRHIKKLVVLIVLMTVFFAVIDAINPLGGVLSVTLGFLGISLCIVHGIACSLAARSVAGALISCFAFPLIILIIPPMLSAMFRESAPGILWTSIFLLLPLSLFFSYLRKNAFSVTFFLTMFHLALISLLTCWVAFFGDRDLPMMSIHPAVQAFYPLMNDRPYELRNHRGAWPSIQVMYALGMVLNHLWLFWWMCRHYEVLSGRKELSRGRKGRMQAVALVESGS